MLFYKIIYLVHGLHSYTYLFRKFHFIRHKPNWIKNTIKKQNEITNYFQKETILINNTRLQNAWSQFL